MYLLDTNHCSHILRGHSVLLQKISTVPPDALMSCVIVQGEMVFMAEKSAKKTHNRHQVRLLLENLTILEIDAEAADIYGDLKALVIHHFGPKEKAKRRKVTIERLGFTENDLWIAAIAKRHKLTIVSADSDFERLKTVTALSVKNWLMESSS